MENENEEAEVLSVEVTVVVEKLLAEAVKTNRRIDALEVIVGEQQVALRDAVATLKAIVAGRTDWPRPSVAKSRSN